MAQTFLGRPPRIKVVNTLPALANAKIGEMFLLLNGDDANKIHIRVTSGWIKTAALT